MKLSDFVETDTLYVEPSAGRSNVSEEISDGVVADYDGERLLGLELERASKRLDATRLETVGTPIAQLLAASLPRRPTLSRAVTEHCNHGVSYTMESCLARPDRAATAVG